MKNCGLLSQSKGVGLQDGNGGLGRSMKLLTKEIIERLPKLRSQESKTADQVKIIVKFFDPTGSWTCWRGD